MPGCQEFKLCWCFQSDETAMEFGHYFWMIVPVFATYVEVLRLQSCLLWSINCERDNVRNTLVFLSPFTSILLIFVPSFPRASFLMPTPCLLTCEFTAVLPSCTALFIPAFYINIIQITVMVPTSHQSTYIQWRPQPQTNKVRFNTGNINLYFNIFKLKSIYWQTISYNKMCSYLKLSFLPLLMSKANWLGNQQLAMFTWLMRLHFPILLLSSVSSIVHN